MYHLHYLEAIETVLNWDLPDEALTDAFNQQLALITHQSGDFDDRDSMLQ